MFIDGSRNLRENSHNPKAVGSNPTPATKKLKIKLTVRWAFFLLLVLEDGFEAETPGLQCRPRELDATERAMRRVT